jgi:hypothetical protein
VGADGTPASDQVVAAIGQDRQLELKHVVGHEIKERLNYPDAFDPDALDVMLPFLEKCLGLVANPGGPPQTLQRQDGPPKMAGMTEEQITERLGRLRARGGAKGGAP